MEKIIIYVKDASKTLKRICQPHIWSRFKRLVELIEETEGQKRREQCIQQGRWSARRYIEIGCQIKSLLGQIFEIAHFLRVVPQS